MEGFGGSTGVSKGYVDRAIAQSTANSIQARNATCTIASIAANGTADVDCVLSSAFTNAPNSYVLMTIGSTNIIGIAVRSWTDGTHFNCRFYNCGGTSATNVSLTFRIIGLSAAVG